MKYLMCWALATVKPIQILESLGAKVAGLVFLIELPDLGGRKLIDGYEINSVLSF